MWALLSIKLMYCTRVTSAPTAQESRVIIDERLHIDTSLIPSDVIEVGELWMVMGEVQSSGSISAHWAERLQEDFNMAEWDAALIERELQRIASKKDVV